MKNLILSLSIILCASIKPAIASETFMSFDFIDANVENGFANWNYSDLGENPCQVYDGTKQSKLCSQSGERFYQYYNGYNTNHMGWTRFGFIDAESDYAISGSSLEVHMTGGVYLDKSGNLQNLGITAKSKDNYSNPDYLSESTDTSPTRLSGDMSLYYKTKYSSTKIQGLKGKNRLSVWILMPQSTGALNRYSTQYKARPDRRFSWYPFIGSSKGDHYYHHISNIPMGGWTKVQFDAHPSHNNSGTNNQYDAFTEGGFDFPGDGRSYFENTTAFAFRAGFSAGQPIDTSYYMDEVEVDYTAYENEETINTLSVGYNPITLRFDLSFEDKYRCLKCYAKYEVRYSFEPITNANYNSAFSPSYLVNFNREYNNDKGVIHKPNPGYNLLWSAFDIMPEHLSKLTKGQKIYFAVKDKSSRDQIEQQRIDFEEIEVPEVGFVRKVDLIKTIEYEIHPVFYPLQISTSKLKQGIQGHEYTANITAVGSNGNYTFIKNSKLPDGLSLSEDGILSGELIAKGTYEFEIIVSTDMDKPIYKTFTLKVVEEADLYIPRCKIIAEIKNSKASSNILDDRFSDFFHDTYTGFVGEGFSILIGENKNYNYQGISAENTILKAGSVIRTTWYNNNDSKQYSFAPRVNLQSKGRFSSNDSNWLNSSKISVSPKTYQVSNFMVNADTDIKNINININVENNKQLRLTRIELIEPENSVDEVCIPNFLSEPIHEIETVKADLNISRCKIIAEFKNSKSSSHILDERFSGFFHDKYTGFIDQGFSILIGENKNYNYQGIYAQNTILKADSVIRTTWYNNNDSKQYSFTPRVNLQSKGRFSSNDSNWLNSSAISVSPKTYQVSNFTINADTDIKNININVNKENNKQLRLTRIELVEPQNSADQVCPLNF